MEKNGIKMIQCMRWYGPEDPVSLMDIRQAGCTGIVTALHHLPNGVAWSREEIEKRKAQVEEAGFAMGGRGEPAGARIHKNQDREFHRSSSKIIKPVSGTSRECGIHIITYNFMPVLDWTRTDLAFPQTRRIPGPALRKSSIYCLRSIHPETTRRGKGIFTRRTRNSKETFRNDGGR